MLEMKYEQKTIVVFAVVDQESLLRNYLKTFLVRD